MEDVKCGSLSHQVDVEVPASVAWELYGSLRLAELVKDKLSSVVSDVEVLQGDGGVGTLIKLTFNNNNNNNNQLPGFTEKFTVVDSEKRVKETEVVEGGYLELGFTLYRVRFEISDDVPGKSCVIKSSVYYELPQGSPDNLASIDSLAAIALIAKDYLTTNNNNNTN